MPHLCVDAIDVAAQIVNALQRIVSRHMKPQNPSVVTVGEFKAGTAYNIISKTAYLSGTTRTFDPKVWKSWAGRIDTVVKGICQAMGATYELKYQPGYPVTVNNSWMAEQIGDIAGGVVGADHVVEPETSMGGEDMSFFLDRSKGCFFFLGIGREGVLLFTIHVLISTRMSFSPVWKFIAGLRSGYWEIPEPVPPVFLNQNLRTIGQMLAWQISEYGKFEEVLRLASCEIPCDPLIPALIRVEAVGLNYLDILSIAGKYQERGPLPFIPGVEAAGRVVETGPGSPFKIGDKVMTMGNAACAEYMPAGPDTTFLIPGGMSCEQAAAFQLVYQTAHVGLVHRARLKAGEWLLVHAGAGGVGTAAIQVGRAIGARVIATAGNDRKLNVCRRAGAEAGLNYRQNRFSDSIREITGGRGADVIFDPVGGETFEESTRCVAFEGRILTIGYASGRIPSIAVNRILLKNMDVIGLFWGNYRAYDPEHIRRTQVELNHLWSAGKINPVIFEQFEFEKLPEALTALAGRKSYGKVVLKGPAACS